MQEFTDEKLLEIARNIPQENLEFIEDVLLVNELQVKHLQQIQIENSQTDYFGPYLNQKELDTTAETVRLKVDKLLEISPGTLPVLATYWDDVVPVNGRLEALTKGIRAAFSGKVSIPQHVYEKYFPHGNISYWQKGGLLATGAVVLARKKRARLISSLAHEITHMEQNRLDLPHSTILREGHARSIERRIAREYYAEENNPAFLSSPSTLSYQELTAFYVWLSLDVHGKKISEQIYQQLDQELLPNNFIPYNFLKIDRNNGLKIDITEHALGSSLFYLLKLKELIDEKRLIREFKPTTNFYARVFRGEVDFSRVCESFPRFFHI